MNQKTKVGVHVSGSARDNYGLVAPKLTAVVSFDPGAFDEVSDECVKVFRTHSVANHKDAPGDFDHLLDEELFGSAIFWWENHLEPIYRQVKAKYGDNVWFQPVNEVNNVRMIKYLRGMVHCANRDGYKLALFGDAGDSPSIADWATHWLPFLHEVNNENPDHIYIRHAYSGVEGHSSGNSSTYMTTEDFGLTDNNVARPFVEANMMLERGMTMGLLIGELGWFGGWSNLPSGWLEDFARYDSMMMAHPLIIGGVLWNAGNWETAPNILSGKPLADLSSYLADKEPEFFSFGNVSNPAPNSVEVPNIANESEPVLVQERFQTNNWYDWELPNGNPSNQQVPLGWEVDNAHGENPFAGGKSWNDFGYPEAAYLTAGHNLPPTDESKYTVHKSLMPGVDGGVVYKLFSNHAFFSDYGFKVDVKAGDKLRAYLEFFSDFCLYRNPSAGDFSKTLDGLDPMHGHVTLSIRYDNDGPVLLRSIDHQARNQVEENFVADRDGTVIVEFGFLSRYAMAPNVGSAAFFITEMSLFEVREEEEEPVMIDPEQTPAEWMWERAEAQRTQRFNADAGLEKRIIEDGFVPTGNEEWNDHPRYGHFAIQGAINLITREERVYYVPVGLWDKIEFIPDLNSVPVPPELGFQFNFWPTLSKTITQKFGANYEYYNSNFGLPGHEGIDIRATHGVPIFSVSDGIVKTVIEERQSKDNGGHNYGIHVRINHKDGYQTIYAHLDRHVVAEGQRLVAGQLIGFADNTGNSFGSHLHFTLKKDGKIIDPTPFLKRDLPIPDYTSIDPDPVRPPSPKAFDLVEWFTTGHGKQTMVKTYLPEEGQQERFRVEHDEVNKIFWIIKNHQWEKYPYDEKFIYQDIDTSPGNGEFYTVRKSRTSNELAPRCPRYMEDGEKWVSDITHWVQFWNKGTGNRPATKSDSPYSGEWTNTAHVKGLETVTTPDGEVLRALRIQMGREDHFLVKGLPPVGWEMKVDNRMTMKTKENVDHQAIMAKEVIGFEGQ